MNIQEFEKLAKSRCSHRKYLQDEIPKQDVEKMVELAVTAPSGHNLQPWKFIAITSDKLKSKMVQAITDELNKIKSALDEKYADKLDKFSFFITHFETAPLAFAVLGRKDEYISAKIREISNGAMAKPEHFDMELLGIGAAIQNLLLSATSMGYGTCWLTAPINYAQEALEKVLEIENSYNLISILAIGKPTKDRKQPQRKPLDHVLSFK